MAKPTVRWNKSLLVVLAIVFTTFNTFLIHHVTINRNAEYGTAPKVDPDFEAITAAATTTAANEGVSNRENKDFICPKSLYGAWNMTEIMKDHKDAITSSLINEHTPSSSLSPSIEIPQIVLMRLEEEKGTFYLNRTQSALHKYNYSSFCESDAVNGVEILGPNATQSRIKDVFGINFSREKLTEGEMGCWMSHLSTWHLGLKYNKATVSLESDAVAKIPWSITDQTLYKNYDILYMHKHKELKKSCDKSRGEHVREGIDTWFATGAMLFTNNNPMKVKRVFQEELFGDNVTIVEPIGHWLNHMFRTNKLKIGSLCPHHFEQLQDHVSTIKRFHKEQK